MNITLTFIKRGEGLDLHIREDIRPQTVGHDHRREVIQSQGILAASRSRKRQMAILIRARGQPCQSQLPVLLS